MKRRTFSKSFVQALPFPFAGRRSSSLFFILLAVSALIFSALNPQTASLIQVKALDMAAPMLDAVSKPLQDSAVFVRDVSGLATMQEENERLRQENIRLRQWYHKTQTLMAENESLHALLNVKIEPHSKYVTARVLSDSGSRFVKSFLVTGGTADGVEKSQAVISEDGVIGRVIEAGEDVSRVLLVTDINSRVPVVIEDSKVHGILAGQNEANPVLIHIPGDLTVKDGARVYTSGKGGVFPPGLPVGRIVKKGDANVIELFADFNRIMYVRIIEKASNPGFVQKQ